MGSTALALPRQLRLSRLYSVALIFAAALTAAAQQPCGCLHPIAVERIHDADTIFGSIDLEIGGISITPEGGFRAGNYDAYEVDRTRERVVGTITPEEMAKGKAATAALKDLLNQGQLYGKPSSLRDPHGRIDVDLYLKMPNGWLDIAAWMDAHNFLRTPRK
jgi:hypothetical protein